MAVGIGTQAINYFSKKAQNAKNRLQGAKASVPMGFSEKALGDRILAQKNTDMISQLDNNTKTPDALKTISQSKLAPKYSVQALDAARAKAQKPASNPASTNTTKLTPAPAPTPEQKLATLINPKTGEKRVVNSGSPAANPFIKAGYVVMGSQEEKDAKTRLAEAQKQAQAANQPAQVMTGAMPAQPVQAAAPAAALQAAAAQPDQIQALRAAILASLQPGAEERSTSNALGELISGTNENIANLEGQGRGITLDLVRGQQGALARQAEAQSQTLESRLARAQAERQAALQAAQTLLGFEQQDRTAQQTEAQSRQQQLQSLALQAAQGGASAEEIQGILGASDFGGALGGASKFLKQGQAPIKVGAGETLYDPTTGQPIFTAPKTGNGDADEFLSVTEAEALGVPYGTTKGQAYGLGVTGKPTVEQSKARQFAVSADEANKVLSTVNYNVGSVEFWKPNFLKSAERQQFEQASRAFVNSVLRRESGATLTDPEFINKSQELIPQPGDKTEVLEQKARAREAAVRSIQDAGGLASSNQMQVLINEAKNQGYTDAEIQEYLQSRGFNQVGADTKTGSVKKIADAIGQYESGGNYRARGPVVNSGQYAGQRALGKYQIMPGNLPSWSKAALGRAVSEQEFLSNPQIQDAIAQFKMNEILQKYGTVEDVASVWFSGKPLAKAGNAKDVIGTSVPQYVKNVVANYQRLA